MHPSEKTSTACVRRDEEEDGPPAIAHDDRPPLDANELKYIANHGVQRGQKERMLDYAWKHLVLCVFLQETGRGRLRYRGKRYLKSREIAAKLSNVVQGNNGLGRTGLRVSVVVRRCATGASISFREAPRRCPFFSFGVRLSDR